MSIQQLEHIDKHPETRGLRKRRSILKQRLQATTLAFVLGILGACKAPESVTLDSPHPGIVELEQGDDMEFSRLKSQYNTVVSSIRTKYDIIVKIAEPSDYSYMAHHSQKAGDYLYFVKKIDHEKL